MLCARPYGDGWPSQDVPMWTELLLLPAIGPLNCREVSWALCTPFSLL